MLSPGTPAFSQVQPLRSTGRNLLVGNGGGGCQSTYSGSFSLGSESRLALLQACLCWAAFSIQALSLSAGSGSCFLCNLQAWGEGGRGERAEGRRTSTAPQCCQLSPVLYPPSLVSLNPIHTSAVSSFTDYSSINGSERAMSPVGPCRLPGHFLGSFWD